MLLTKSAIGYCAILVAGALLALGVKIDSGHDYTTEREHYIETSRNDASTVVRRVHNAIEEIYESLRTLTALPSVRKIDRHGTNLGEDGRETIQQVYNNLASNVSVSEVYIVPADLDPDRIDPVTGKPEEPILMFDQLIVNAGGRAVPQRDKYSVNSADAPNLPAEVETYEYRQSAINSVG